MKPAANGRSVIGKPDSILLACCLFFSVFRLEAGEAPYRMLGDGGFAALARNEGITRLWYREYATELGVSLVPGFSENGRSESSLVPSIAPIPPHVWAPPPVAGGYWQAAATGNHGLVLEIVSSGGPASLEIRLPQPVAVVSNAGETALFVHLPGGVWLGAAASATNGITTGRGTGVVSFSSSAPMTVVVVFASNQSGARRRLLELDAGSGMDPQGFAGRFWRGWLSGGRLPWPNDASLASAQQRSIFALKGALLAGRVPAWQVAGEPAFSPAGQLLAAQAFLSLGFVTESAAVLERLTGDLRATNVLPGALGDGQGRPLAAFAPGGAETAALYASVLRREKFSGNLNLVRTLLEDLARFRKEDGIYHLPGTHAQPYPGGARNLLLGLAHYDAAQLYEIGRNHELRDAAVAVAEGLRFAIPALLDNRRVSDGGETGRDVFPELAALAVLPFHGEDVPVLRALAARVRAVIHEGPSGVRQLLVRQAGGWPLPVIESLLYLEGLQNGNAVPPRFGLDPSLAGPLAAGIHALAIREGLFSGALQNRDADDGAAVLREAGEGLREAGRVWPDAGRRFEFRELEGVLRELVETPARADAESLSKLVSSLDLLAKKLDYELRPSRLRRVQFGSRLERVRNLLLARVRGISGLVCRAIRTSGPGALPFRMEIMLENHQGQHDHPPEVAVTGAAALRVFSRETAPGRFLVEAEAETIFAPSLSTPLEVHVSLRSRGVDHRWRFEERLVLPDTRPLEPVRLADGRLVLHVTNRLPFPISACELAFDGTNQGAPFAGLPAGLAAGQGLRVLADARPGSAGGVFSAMVNGRRIGYSFAVPAAPAVELAGSWRRTAWAFPPVAAPPGRATAWFAGAPGAAADASTVPDGQAWFIRDFHLPAGAAAGRWVLVLDQVDGPDLVLVNNRMIGAEEYPGNRRYVLPDGVLNADRENRIALALCSWDGVPGRVRGGMRLELEP
jgi:hypothetical protein